MKTTRASLTLVSLLPVTALILAACAADTADPGAETSPRPGALSAPRAHLLPMPGAARPFHGAASGTAHMVYRGGPVISSVKVYAVFWGASVPNQSALDGYLRRPRQRSLHRPAERVRHGDPADRPR